MEYEKRKKINHIRAESAKSAAAEGLFLRRLHLSTKVDSVLGGSKIKSFTDLEVWQEAHALVLLVYPLTRNFPKEEIFGLVTQMRRAAISITSNIAEGFSRYSYKEKIQFYSIARGSLTELQSQLLVARDVKYIDIEKFEQISRQSIIVHKLLNAFIKKTREF